MKLKSKVSERMFSPENLEILNSLNDPNQKREFFFKCWTFHEAFIKALGRTVFSTEESKKFIKFKGPEDRIIQFQDWTLMEIDVPDSYKGALATKAPHPQIEIHQFS